MSYDYEKVNGIYELYRVRYYGLEVEVVGYTESEREAYYWYCKMNGLHYDANLEFES